MAPCFDPKLTRPCGLVLCAGLAMAVGMALGCAPCRASAAPDICHNAEFIPPLDVAPKRNIVIVIDLTVRFQSDTQSQILDLVDKAVQDSDEVRVFSFSALTLKSAVKLELQEHVKRRLTAEELGRISQLFILKAQQCRDGEIYEARGRIHGKVAELISHPVDDEVASEIVESISAIPIAGGPAAQCRDAMMIVVSDMLENSKSLYSMYLPGNLGHARLDGFLRLIAAKKMLGHFAGARVFVVGAATVAASGKALTPDERQNLEGFWNAWFEKSNGRIKAWGQPYPLDDAR